MAIKIKHSPGGYLLIIPARGAWEGAYAENNVSGDSSPDYSLAYAGAAVNSDRTLAALSDLAVASSTTEEIYNRLAFEDGVYDRHQRAEWHNGAWHKE